MRFAKNKYCLFGLVICTVTIMLLLYPSTIIAAGFDCAKAKTKTENIICQDSKLSHLDNELNKFYFKVKNYTNLDELIKKQQVEWLRNRDKCKDIACLQEIYEDRILYLRFFPDCRFKIESYEICNDAELRDLNTKLKKALYEIRIGSKSLDYRMLKHSQYMWREIITEYTRKDSKDFKILKKMHRNRIERLKSIGDTYYGLSPVQIKQLEMYFQLLKDGDWLTGIWLKSFYDNRKDLYYLIEKKDGKYQSKTYSPYPYPRPATSRPKKIVKHDNYAEFWDYKVVAGEVLLEEAPSESLYLEKKNPLTLRLDKDFIDNNIRPKYELLSEETISLEEIAKQEFVTGENYLKEEQLKSKRLLDIPTQYLLSNEPLPAIDFASIRKDVRGVNEYHKQIHPNLKPVDFYLLGDKEENCITEIRIYWQGETEPMQILTADIGSPYRGAAYFHTQDMNGDGYKDFKLLSSAGATGNEFFKFWIFNPATNSYAYDKELSDLGNPHPTSNGEYYTWTRFGHGGHLYVESWYKYINNKLTKTKEIEQDYDSEKNKYIKFTKKLIDGHLEIVNTKEIGPSELPQY